MVSRVRPTESRSTLLVAIPVDMVYHQEVLFRLTAARAFESVVGVMTKHCSPESFSPHVATVLLQGTIIFRLVGNRPPVNQSPLIRVSRSPILVVSRAYEWAAITAIFLRSAGWLVCLSTAMTSARIRWNALRHFSKPQLNIALSVLTTNVLLCNAYLHKYSLAR